MPERRGLRDSLKSVVNQARTIARFATLDPPEKAGIVKRVREATARHYLSRYLYAIGTGPADPRESDQQGAIWQLWYQGFDRAPGIVRRCTDTVRTHAQGRQIILLDERTIEKHAALPGYLYDKKRKGQLSNVYFSDVVRACLLAEHGGTWIDSTVFLTGPIPPYVTNARAFCFSSTPAALGGSGNILASNWFIHAHPKGVLMKAMRDLLLEYWKHETRTRHDYFFHLFFALAAGSHEQCRREWEGVPFFSNVPPHVLQFELGTQYSEERFEQIKQMSPIHKLSLHRGPVPTVAGKETFYDVLLGP